MMKELFKHRFVSATFWMFIATGVLNAGNYLYHLVMGRLLGRELYGALESVISILYIVSIPMMTITLVTVKFVSAHKGKSDLEAISRYYHYIKDKMVLYGTIITIILALISPFIVSFLHLPSIYLPLFIAASFFVSLFVVLNRAMLQGLSNFFGVAVSNAFETAAKLVLAILLVLIGFKTEGAFAAIVLAAFMGYVGAYYFINKLQLREKGAIDQRQLFGFAVPVFFTTLAMTSLFTSDVILVRHFFPGVESGDYAALSILGKIIFFAVSPIMFVMFPFVSEHQARGEKYAHFLFLSVALTLIGAGSITFIYFLIPEFMITILFGSKFLEITKFLGVFGIFITFYSLCYLFANFYLSIHKTKVAYLTQAAALAQIIMIWFFHASLLDVVYISLVIVFLLLVAFLLYYPHATKERP